MQPLNWSFPNHINYRWGTNCWRLGEHWWLVFVGWNKVNKAKTNKLISVTRLWSSTTRADWIASHLSHITLPLHEHRYAHFVNVATKQINNKLQHFKLISDFAQDYIKRAFTSGHPLPKMRTCFASNKRLKILNVKNNNITRVRNAHKHDTKCIIVLLEQYV